MNLREIGKKDFLDLVYKDKDDFMSLIDSNEIFIVKNFYPSEKIKAYRDTAFMEGLQSDPSWHPCFDDCPDYHRIHDNYPKAYVKAKMHAFYYHGFYEKNNALFDYFREIFDMKNFLAGSPSGSYIRNIPSQFYIARVNMHNYPRGGGYQAEHVDPVSKFALIQTIVQASKLGEDFKTGGLYARQNLEDPKFYVDPYTEVGDLIVLTPRIYHGIDPIDPEEDYDWKKNNGRWMIMPIIIHSDYESPFNKKPEQVK